MRISFNKSLAVWSVAGGVVALAYSLIITSHDIWAFSITIPIKPKIFYEYDQKMWRTEVIQNPFDLGDAIKAKYGIPTSEPYVSKVFWNSVHRYPYIEISIRAPKGQSPEPLAQEITQFMNETYAPLSEKAFAIQQAKFQKLSELQNQLQLRMKDLGNVKTDQKPLAAAMSDLLSVRISDIQNELDFTSAALTVEGAKTFKTLAPVTGAYSGRYPNIWLCTVIGVICGAILGIGWQLVQKLRR